jgi:peroxiredoxin
MSGKAPRMRHVSGIAQLLAVAFALIAACLAIAVPLGVGLAESAWWKAGVQAREGAGASSGPVDPSSADLYVQSQAHPLLGQSAPRFELRDCDGQRWKLNHALARGPVVLVFYFGYHCNHCVGQLFALHNDIERFRALHATVVAVSADPAETTRDRFRQHGAFAFPVLSDPGQRIARNYGVFQPASAGKRESLEHATFVIGRDGTIHWAQHGAAPFIGNRALLSAIASVEGRVSGFGEGSSSIRSNP